MSKHNFSRHCEQICKIRVAISCCCKNTNFYFVIAKLASASVAKRSFFSNLTLSYWGRKPEISRHCETYEVSRGNLIRIAGNLENVQLAIKRDCHESACTDSRNDKEKWITTQMLTHLLAMTIKHDCHAQTSRGLFLYDNDKSIKYRLTKIARVESHL